MAADHLADFPKHDIEGGRNGGRLESGGSMGNCADEVHRVTTSPRFVLGLTNMGPGPLPTEAPSSLLATSLRRALRLFRAGRR